MRIGSGKFKGRVLKEFEGLSVRPTSDRARESLFDILGEKIRGARFLDLFAGSGAVGIEALSRGAAFATFTDAAKTSLDLVKSNLSACGTQGECVQADAIAFLEKQTRTFDVIFIDPPYKSDLATRALRVIAERKLLSENGVAVWESETPFTGDVGLFDYDFRRYGRAYLTFFTYRKPACVYAGTFDPVTTGHLDVIRRAAKEFNTVYVALMVNPEKTPYFTEEERLCFLKKACEEIPRVKVEFYGGYAAEYLKLKNTPYYVRGVRSDADKEYEEKNAEISWRLNPEMELVFYHADGWKKNVSSSAAKEAIRENRNYEKYLPKAILPLVKRVICERTAKENGKNGGENGKNT